MPRQTTPATTLDNLRKEAKRWLKALRANVADSHARLRRAWPDAPSPPGLRDVQHALAREHGLPGWGALKNRLHPDSHLRRYERVAEALVLAYGTGDESALRVVWDFFGHRRSLEGMRRYIRLDLGRPEELQDGEADAIALADAQALVAWSQEFESWDELAAFASTVSPRQAIPAKAVAAFAMDADGGRNEVSHWRLWDQAIARLHALSEPGLHAHGQMTDALLERISRVAHVTALDLEGSRNLTTEGLRCLARLPALRHLNLAGCGVTDEGLAILRELPALESLVLAWTRVTDAGAAHLGACEQLRAVDLSGTPTGDGAIAALAGKRLLCDFRSGNQVTDAGLARIRELPVFGTWHGGVERMSLLGFDAGPNYLMLRGPFTDAGFASLGALEGLFALNVDSDRLAITGAALAPLADLPHLAWLAFDARDQSMPHIAALPRLRFLMCQDTPAGDEGFMALSRSPTIEYIWGRRCHNLRRRGFTALASMPALRSLSVSCRNVDDPGLSALPRFPALRELMPMDIRDEGYVHVGGCERLESLVLMYCRETTDVATEHITGLPGLKKYFASYTRITDRTPQLLSGMPSLESITFDSCAGLTTAGIASLASLPRLRELHVSGMRPVKADVVAAFPSHVRVRRSI
ncbi:MAG TPA: hypothetical protein VML96_02465 [Egibacteraceae bacterium]|nr:hypothetical protein [Egibacteraceae bacterium]